MNKDDLIKKWLDHNLNPEEQKAFEALDDYENLIKLSDSVTGFKAPYFDKDEVFITLKNQLKTRTKRNIIKPLLRLAAVLLIGFSVFYYTSNLDSHIQTLVTEQTTIELPDASIVTLNSESNLTYNKNKWKNNRTIVLDGEAYFKVAKGSTFDVKTSDGIVSVLGTEFNVKQRENYFEVTCFEGLVAVRYNETMVKLIPGNRFAVIDGKIIADEKENKSQPDWTAHESTFASRPLKFVIEELQRQYNTNVTVKNVDTKQLFTGSFTHKDLDLALKSITLPLGLTYSKTKTGIILTGE